MTRRTVDRQLRRLELAGAIARERRRVEGRLRTGWTLAGDDPVEAAAGSAAPTAPADRVRAAAVVRREGVARVRRVRALVGLPAGWHARAGWRRASRLADEVARALREAERPNGRTVVPWDALPPPPCPWEQERRDTW